MSGLAQQLVHSGASVPDAQTRAQGLIYQLLGAQSQTLAYLDTFMALAIGAGIMFLLSFLVRKNDPRGVEKWRLVKAGVQRGVRRGHDQSGYF